MRVKKPSTPKTQSNDPFQKAHNFLEKFTKFQKSLNGWFLEREDIIEGIFLAMITKQNVLIVGKHGTAKSELVSTLFKAFSKSRLFNIQMTQFTPEDAVFGPVNIKAMQEQGIIEYNTEGMLPDAQFAFLDEMMDANEAVLRSCLDILNERQFRKGRQQLQCPLHTAVATTNFMHETEGLEAVLDRFLIKMTVGALEKDESVVTMVEKYIEKDRNKSIPVPSFALSDLEHVRNTLSLVRFDKDLITLYGQLVSEYHIKLGGSVYISDRRKCWGINLVRASALLAGRKAVEPEDLDLARFAFVTLGESDHELAWTSVSNYLLKSYAIVREEKVNVDLIAEALDVISKRYKRTKKSATPDHLAALAKKVRTVINAIDNRDTSKDSQMPGIVSEYNDLHLKATNLNDDIVATTMTLMK